MRSRNQTKAFLGRERRRITPMGETARIFRFGHLQHLIFDPVCSIGLNSKAAELFGLRRFLYYAPSNYG
jgi:hypothetical protein